MRILTYGPVSRNQGFVPGGANRTRGAFPCSSHIETSSGFQRLGRFSFSTFLKADSFDPILFECAQAAHELRAAASWAEYRFGLERPDLVGRAANIENCSVQRRWIGRNGVQRPNFWRCKDRLCPRCNQDLFYQHRRSLMEAYRQMHNPVFVTVALGCRGLKDLGATITRLRESFQKLRSRKVWEAKVLGAVGTLEVFFGEKKRRFQPHLHLVVELREPIGHALGEWQQELNGAFAKYVGGRGDIDVRRIENGRQLLSYIRKPHGRFPWPGQLKPSELFFFAVGVKYRRTLLTIGKFHARQGSTKIARADDCTEHADDCTPSSKANGGKNGKPRAVLRRDSFTTRMRDGPGTGRSNASVRMGT